ncbi:UNVERIFIED_CONTAM: hypothetical protein Slati_2910200 [Sesamum latifolium]|uniref:Reverse transcriptase n=1 Tax=Sesamum latifolium TaxID=2727402 RepID=A0AAW2VCT8_9LAMI
MDAALGFIEQRATTAMNDELSQPFTSEEITLALKQMHPLKSPGLDDMSPIFYQKYWSIVGSEVCNLILDFLNNSSLNLLINFTHIVLIPKWPNPSNMTQFRPISVCNVIYKLASKVIANRIKPFLGALVSDSQSAFIPGRLIMDNVLLAYELNHFLKQKIWGKKGHASIKLDAKVFSGLICKAESEATEEALSRFQLVLTSFEAASGLQINKQKSAMVFSRNVEVEARSVLARALGVNVVSKHDKYLGLPLVTGHSKKEMFEGIKECIWKKLHIWSSKQLSQAGLAVLLKIVLQTIPTYAMSYFRVLDTYLNEWLREFNIALLKKKAWRVAIGLGGVLDSVLGYKYFLQCSFFESRLGSSPSYTWRSVWGTRDVLASGLPWKDGERDSLVWHFERQGRFSVRSAYRVASRFREEAECSVRAQSWDFLCSSKAPPRVLLFAWRCAHDALSTTVHLRRCGIRLDDGRGCCGTEAEDVLHVLFYCSRHDWFGTFSDCPVRLSTVPRRARKAGSERSTESGSIGLGPISHRLLVDLKAT